MEIEVTPDVISKADETCHDANYVRLLEQRILDLQMTVYTKREYFAAMAMQGLLANMRVSQSGAKVCESAIMMADKLLQELGK
jgi:hypothetical protein